MERKCTLKVKKQYWGSVLFFKHLIIGVILLMILIPTVTCFILLSKQRALEEEIKTLKAQLIVANGVAGNVQQLPAAVPAADPGSGKDYQSRYPRLYSLPLGDTVYKEKVMYLTFDDGPSAECTGRVLDVLKKYDVKATFFVIGFDPNSERKKELLRRIVAEGHTIGIHTYSHDYDLIYSSVDAYLEDFNKVHELVYEATGVNADIFRFPGGSINDYNSHIYQEIVDEMTRRGFRYYDWNISSNDAVGDGVSPSRLVQNVLGQSKNVRRGIVLFHDSATKSTTVEALPQIIAGLKEQGYEFAALKKNIVPVKF